MATRKDLLKAHKFTSDRLVAALALRDPDRVDSPLRRIIMGTFASVMIGIVIMAGFGVVGMINPGNNSQWKEQESLVVIDTEAGQVFWYRNPTLYPMENITSAKLASNGAEVVSLKSKSLRGVERGEQLGIAGAPGELPRTEDLTFYPAQVCATAPDEDAAEPGTRHTTLSIGSAAEPAGNAVPAVLTDAENNEYLVVDGMAHLVPKAKGETQSALTVALAYPRFERAYGLLSTLPVGSELSAERITAGIRNLGKPSNNPAGDAATIGDLVQVAGSEATYVLLADGLSQIRPLELKAMEAAGHAVFELSSQEVSQHLSTQQPSLGANDLPTVLPPQPSTAGMEAKALCATWESADSRPVISVDVTPPEVTAPKEDPRIADVVATEPGNGALLANSLTTGEPQAAVLVVQGMRFGIPDAEAMAALGYGETEKDRVSSAILNLIPPGLPGGMSLSIDAAGRPPQR